MEAKRNERIHTEAIGAGRDMKRADAGLFEGSARNANKPALDRLASGLAAVALIRVGILISGEDGVCEEAANLPGATATPSKSRMTISQGSEIQHG